MERLATLRIVQLAEIKQFDCTVCFSDRAKFLRDVIIPNAFWGRGCWCRREFERDLEYRVATTVTPTVRVFVLPSPVERIDIRVPIRRKETQRYCILFGVFQMATDAHTPHF